MLVPKSKLLPENAVLSEEPPYKNQMIWAESPGPKWFGAEMTRQCNAVKAFICDHTVVRNTGIPLKISIETVLFSAQKSQGRTVRYYLYSVITCMRVTNNNKSAEIKMKYSIVKARSTYYSDISHIYFKTHFVWKSVGDQKPTTAEFVERKIK